MEPVFECKTLQTKALLRQAGARLMRTKLIIHAAVLLAASAVFAAFVLIKQLENAYFFAAAFCMACVALAIYRFQSVPNKFAEQTYTEYLNFYREPACTVVRVWQGQMAVENLQQRSVHHYSRAECGRLLESSDLFLIPTKKTVILMEKAGFSVGTPEEFRSFWLNTAAKHQP